MTSIAEEHMGFADELNDELRTEINACLRRAVKLFLLGALLY